MTDRKQDYQGLLHFEDGRSEQIIVPGVKSSDGEIYVPKSITVDGKYFELSSKGAKQDLFIYEEVISSNETNVTLH